jgi:type VI secretion system protein ImpL
LRGRFHPLRGSQGAVKGAAAATLNELWQTEVYATYARMKDAYPFARDAQHEVPLADFAEFFRPGSGTLWRFYEENLASRFTRSGSRFTLVATERESGMLPALTACLSEGQRITEAVFLGDPREPGISFGVQMQAPGAGVAETVLGVGDQVLTYRNEPVQMRALEWPGKGSGARVQVSGQMGGDPFRDQQQSHGDFAFFRLLEAGHVQPVSPGAIDLEAVWPLHRGEARVVMRFRPPTARHPFRRGFFQRFRCPASIVSPGKGKS